MVKRVTAIVGLDADIVDENKMKNNMTTADDKAIEYNFLLCLQISYSSIFGLFFI
jgi:hypothetical protein